MKKATKKIRLKVGEFYISNAGEVGLVVRYNRADREYYVRWYPRSRDYELYTHHKSNGKLKEYYPPIRDSVHDLVASVEDVPLAKLLIK